MPSNGSGSRGTLRGWLAENLRPETVLPFAFFAILIASIAVPFSFQRRKDIEILASISGQSDDSVAITGRVLYKGQGLPNGTIIAVATTFKGNEYSAQGRTAGEGPTGGQSQDQPFEKVATASAGPGSFDLLVERKPSPNSGLPLHKLITSISLRASTADNKTSGTEQLVVNHGDGFQQMEFAMTAIAPLVGLFIFGLFWAFRRPDQAIDRRFQYYISIFCALALTMTMLAIITISLKNISTRVGELSGSKRNVVLSLGFAYVFKGTYVKDGEPEWLFSFTTRRLMSTDPESNADVSQEAPEAVRPDGGAPTVDSPLKVAGGPTAPPGKRGGPGAPKAEHESGRFRQPDELATPIKGLGAPLWVLLLSVLGAAVLTISMVVSWVRQPLSDDDEISLRQRLEGIVRHQFYILFAPIGSVFVFQTLVAGEAASQPLAVGIAAFGSGMALSRLLNVAVDAAMKYLPKGAGDGAPP